MAGAPRGRSVAPKPNPVDGLMDRASVALVGGRYFDAERLALGALERAHRSRDFERIARIALPLQEARRQRRLEAVDTGIVRVVDSRAALRAAPAPGCYLVQPPLVGIDARGVRERAIAKGLPVLVITREPMTRDGLWPVVAATTGLTIRARIAPPEPLARVEGTWTNDAPSGPPPPEWFLGAAEAITEEGLKKLDPADAAAWRLDDLMVLLEAHPDDEKMHQRLGEVARRAAAEPPPTEARKRRLRDDPYCF